MEERRGLYKQEDLAKISVCDYLSTSSFTLNSSCTWKVDKMEVTKLLVFLIFGIMLVQGFTSDDKFIKKYAMMKIYESCFGEDVVKQIRKEMKAACARCAILETPPVSPVPVHDHLPPETTQESTKVGPNHEDVNDNNVNPALSFDPERLHQAILSYRPNPFQPTYRPLNTGFYPGYASPGPMFYPGSPVPFTPPYGQFPMYPPGFFGNQRMSRDMDIKSQIEALTARMSGRVRNVTCVMQELGYLDDHLEPNFNKIKSKIGALPISDELKQDIQDGVTFCQQFSQCVPEIKKDKSPLSSELLKPMFFFRCYKHKKLEACVMKDVRERFNGGDTISEPDIEIRRTGKAEKFDDLDEISSSIYEFLYGSDSMDFDSIL